MPIDSALTKYGAFSPGVCTSTTRPTSPYTGQSVYETDTKQGRVWDGLAWQRFPYTPAFSVSVSGSDVLATSKVSFSNVHVNVGNCWSAANNRFVAPIDGLYEFNANMMSNSGTAETIWKFYKNGSAIATPYGNNGNTSRPWTNMPMTIMMSLNANDYIEIWVTAGAITGNPTPTFTGKLIG